MYEKTLAVDAVETIRLIVRGDLNLQGNTGPEILVRFDKENALRSDRINDTLEIECESDCEMHMPARPGVVIQRVGGDGMIRNYPAELDIRQVGGDLAIESVAATRIALVGGDCAVNQVNGPLTIEHVGGDFSGKDVLGPLQLEGVGGDLGLVNAAGTVSGRAGGDIKVSLRADRQSLTLRAGGDLRLYVSENTGLTLNASSGGHSVDLALNGQTRRIESERYNEVIGDGSVRLELRAGGDIRISDTTVELGGDAGERIATKRARWEERMARKTDRAMRKAEAQVQRAEQRAQSAAERAQEKVRRAEERVRQAMEQLEIHRQQRGSGSAIGFTGGPVPDPEPAGASEDEKKLILQMLQEKKISVEEADRLLNALG